MPNDVQAAILNSPKPEALYGKLEDRILARDQKGASDVYYDLVRERRPMKEIVAEAVRIHAPYTHVPYHERIDDGYVSFVNNDHCLLSARAATQLTKMVPEECAALPLAQTIWYIPTGLDIWNQKILKAPGHYARAPGWTPPPGPPPMPEVVWPDQQPEHLDGPLQERLDHWMTLVHRGNVLEAYRVFLGLMENPAERKAVLAQLCHAGLMDVQDRALYNRSYTTGHKAFRARATAELGNALGWDNAHNVIYAGALDIAVGPRWYSTYEMACNVVKIFLEKQTVSAIPYAGASPVELAIAASKLKPEQILDRVDAAVLALNGPDSTAWTKAYLESGADRKPLVQRLALLACRMGNDPHNQEIGQVLLEDYAKNQGHDRDRLLLACAHHTAVHRKYGNPLDCAQRYGAAMGIATLQ